MCTLRESDSTEMQETSCMEIDTKRKTLQIHLPFARKIEINLSELYRDPYHLHICRTVSFVVQTPPSRGFLQASPVPLHESHPTTFWLSPERFDTLRKAVENTKSKHNISYAPPRQLKAMQLLPSLYIRLLILGKELFYKQIGKFISFLLQRFATVGAFLAFSFANCSNTKEPVTPILQLFDGLSNQFMYNLHEPGGNSDPLVNQFLLILDLSQNKAHCIFQDIDNPQVIAKLRELHNRGIDVRVGMDEDNRTYIGYQQLNEFLPSIGRDRKLWIGNKGAGEVYMNFCNVDDRRIAFSTAPLTQIGLQSPAMYGMLQSNEDGIVRKFSGASGLMLNGSFGSSKQRLNQRNHWLIGDTDIGIYLAPEENPVNFIAKRIPNATSSIQVFNTEFFSNRRVTATQLRTNEDIAFETLRSGVPVKTVVGSWKNDLEVDPNALGDCSFNAYLGLDCNPNASSGKSGLSPRRVNSLHYLRTNGIEPRIYADNKPSHSLGITILDSDLSSRMAFVSSHPYSSRGDSSHDGMMFVFQDIANVARIQGFFDAILQKTKSNNSLTGDTDVGFMDIVISEINWMGSGKSVGNDTTSEWIEFYNRTDRPINVSEWSFQCGTNGSFSNVFRFPPRTIIGSRQYFVVQHNQDVSIREAHLTMNLGGRNVINDSRTDQCRILDFNGRVIDVAGNVGVPFITRNTLFGKMDVDRGHYRTMERTRLDLPGENLTNWHTNSNTDPNRNFNFDPDFGEKTFGTPGYANSRPREIPPDLENPFRALVINEYSRVTSPNEVFVELYNPTDVELNFTGKDIYYLRSNNCSIATQKFQDQLLLTGTIPPKGYYVISRSISTHAGIANLLGMGANLASSQCIAIAIGTNVSGLNHPALIDFVNLGNNAIGSLGGSFSSFTRGQRCPNGFKTDVFSNSIDFAQATTSSPGGENLCN